MCVCVCLYTCICVCIYVCVHIYTCICAYICIYTCVCIKERQNVCCVSQISYCQKVATLLGDCTSVVEIETSYPLISNYLYFSTQVWVEFKHT